MFVDFGESYAGRNFFPNDASRKGWFPVHPIGNTSWTVNRKSSSKVDENTRKMIPLKLCWAWTVHKTQGMTIKGKITTELTNKEQEHGSSCATFSRGTRFMDIGVKDGIDKNRLCVKIKKHKRMEKRIKEEARLKSMCERTLCTHVKD